MEKWSAMQILRLTALGTLALAVAGCNRARPEAQNDIENRAWSTVKNQLKADPCGRPAWDTDKWFAKSAAGLAQNNGMYLSVPLARDGRAKSACEQVPVNVSNTLRVPLQDPGVIDYLNALRAQSSISPSGEAAFDQAFHKLAVDLAGEPAQFAGVLFNDVALVSLKEAVSNWKSPDRKDSGMRPGSILVKPIWTAIKKGADTPMPIYPFLELCCAVQNGGTQKLRPDSDFAKATLSEDMNADDFGCQPGIADAQIPKDCFHYYLLPADSRLIGPAQSAIDELSSTLLENRCGSAPCYLVLMGVHIMQRLGPGDPLYDEHHHWLFMTLWWTGQPNGHINELPWKYYQLHATRDLRDEYPGTPNIRRNYLYNPYLEGPRAIGAESNCITCHQFARVTDSGYGSLRSLGVSNCFGGSAPEGIGKSCNLDENQYATCGISADFIWSLDYLNKEGQGLPDPCKSAQPTYLKKNMR